MKNLEKLYTKYGTDKGDIPLDYDTDERFGHKYGLFYQQFFEKYVGRNPSILEIGVYEGASMLAHNDFFNSKCNITGIDVYDSIKFDISKYPNMTFYTGGSEAAETFELLGDKKFDIIIDDAAHTYSNQLFNLLNYHNYLKDDGIYILEDLQTNIDMWYCDNAERGLLNSTFDVLFRKNRSNLITEEEYQFLLHNIDEILLWQKTTDPESYYKMYNVSMTAIIKFKH